MGLTGLSALKPLKRCASASFYVYFIPNAGIVKGFLSVLVKTLILNVIN
jgi:hypothetical protein